MENEKGRYVSMDVEGCDVSNNPDPDEIVLGNVVSSD